MHFLADNPLEVRKSKDCASPAVGGGPQGIFESAGSVVATDS